jgi:hypothetical protein
VTPVAGLAISFDVQANVIREHLLGIPRRSGLAMPFLAAIKGSMSAGGIIYSRGGAERTPLAEAILCLGVPCHPCA